MPRKVADRSAVGGIPVPEIEASRGFFRQFANARGVLKKPPLESGYFEFFPQAHYYEQAQNGASERTESLFLVKICRAAGMGFGA